MKLLRGLSAAIWGIAGLLFGAGPIIFGAQNFERPGGIVAFLVGVCIAGGAYLLHRLTRTLLSRLEKHAV